MNPKLGVAVPVVGIPTPNYGAPKTSELPRAYVGQPATRRMSRYVAAVSVNDVELAIVRAKVLSRSGQPQSRRRRPPPGAPTGATSPTLIPRWGSGAVGPVRAASSGFSARGLLAP